MLIAEQAIVQFQNFIASQVAKHGGVYVAYVLGKARTGTVVIRAGFEEIRALGDSGIVLVSLIKGLIVSRSYGSMPFKTLSFAAKE